MINQLHKRIVDQIQHHEFLYDGAWGDITIKVSENEIEEAKEFLISRKWKIKTVQKDYIIINYQKGASIQLYD